MAALADFARRHCAVFLSFSAIQAMQLLLPLLALPWLARMLGPASFGLLMYFCLFPPLVAILVDWGLAYGGARASAWQRDDAKALASLLGAAIAAKTFLAVAALLLACLMLPLLPHALAHPGPYFLSICAGISRGLNPVWFFQGAGFGMKKAAIFDTASSGLVLCLTLLFVREPANWPLYLLFLAICKGCAFLWLLFSLWRKYRPVPKLRAALSLMRASAPLFGTSFSQLLCYNGGQLGLGYFLNPAEMGIMVAVSKMLRALGSLVNPFTQTLFPELCILRKNAPAKAWRLLRWSLGLTGAIAACACAACWLLAPWLIRISLGPGYQDAIAVLRIALLAAPLMALNNVLSNQILTPFGLEKKQLAVQAGCAALAVPAGACLGSQGLLFGASLPVLLEAAMLAGFIFLVVKFRIRNRL